MRMFKPTIAVLAAAAILSLSTLAFGQSGTPSTTPPPSGGQNQQGPPPGGGGPGGGGQGRGGMDPAAMVERLTKELDLTADQQTKVKDILTKRAADMKTLREDQSTAPEDKRAKSRDIQEASNKAINAVLTPDQQKKYADMQEKMRQGGGGRGPGGSGL